MEIASIAQLKKWFRRGLYPTQEQFHAWLDSFWHKEEKIDVRAVDRLPEMLNEKYGAADGENLELRMNRMDEETTRYRTQTDQLINSLSRETGALSDAVEQECIRLTTRIVLDGGSPADLNAN